MLSLKMDNFAHQDSKTYLMAKQATVSLIISTYNNTDYLELVLLSILQQKTLPDEVIIADDGSRSDTKDLIHKYQQILSVPLHHVWHEDDGFRLSEIKNKAAAQAQCDFIFFIDGDLMLHPHFIYDLKGQIRENRFIVASRAFLSEHFSKKIVESKNVAIPFSTSTFERNMLSAIRIPWLHHFIKGSTTYKGARGGLMGLFKKDYITVNGFDEDYKGWGREDSDLFVRLINSGLERKNIKFAAITYHLWHKILSREGLSKNDALLANAIAEHRTRCINGIDKYLKA